MLSKDVCKRCINSFETPSGNWIDPDEERWFQGYVLCPYVICRRIHVECAPPKECVYSFEHAVAAGMTNDKR